MRANRLSALTVRGRITSSDPLRCFRLWLGVVAVLTAGACHSSATGPDESAEPGADTVRVALTALGTQTYRGFEGGLYPGGVNEPPADHAAGGTAAARLIRPLDLNGSPAAGGRMVLLSIGMSNTTQEFCNPTGAAQVCQAQTFGAQAAADASVNHATLAIVDGAAGGQTAGTWDSPADANYDRVRDQRLAPRGLSESQVQVLWLKVANSNPTRSLVSARSDADTLVTQMANIVRAAKTRYPNLRQVFISSRIYAGYATTTLNPEPYAYESGFAVKWVIRAQIEQDRQGTIVDARAGDLRYPAASPWLAWGPYLWADGLNARPDGLIWQRADLQADGTHPSASGQQKVGAMLLAFFRTSPFTRCWFLSGPSC
jgi:hypothetical protein